MSETSGADASGPRLQPGLYETPIDDQLMVALDGLRAAGYVIHEPDLGELAAPGLLSHFVGARLRTALEQTRDDHPREEWLQRQLAITAALLDALRGATDGAGPARISATHVLNEISPPPQPGVEKAAPSERPSIPLTAVDILINARGDLRVGDEVKRELGSANSVDLLCSFLKWSGYQVLRGQLRKHCGAGRRLRVLTTTYCGVTEARVLDDLLELGAEVRVSFETRNTRLHAKAWLFHRDTRYSTAFVGSSNLSHSALLDGLEWNVRLAEAATPDAFKKMAAAFDGYWDGGEFERYDPVLHRSLFGASGINGAPQTDSGAFHLEVRPYPFQQVMLDQLSAEREIHGRWRNLVVAATGTGKTVLAALDYARVRRDLLPGRLLFVAHRAEILKQAESTFRAVLREREFGELWVGGQRPVRGDHVFASVQTLSHLDLQAVPVNAYDVVIIDEFHHAEAETYRRLLDHFHPKLLLGLTATPERSDGVRVQDAFFGGHIAAELRLWQALEQGLLVPFLYFGVGDDVDLTGLSWSRGGYTAAELNRVLTGNHARLASVLRAIDEHVSDPTRMRALGFCVSIEHARWMAGQFNERGLAARALDQASTSAERASALSDLKAGKIQVVFTVDIFNEGIDVPEVDTVLMLRPTNSSVLFLQQLGRGLRRAEGKACLTVLDFVGNERREYRFEARIAALLGLPAAGIERQISAGFPTLPSGCVLELEPKAREGILRRLRQSISGGPTKLADFVASFPAATLIREVIDASGLSVRDFYRMLGKLHCSVTSVRRERSLLPSLSVPWTESSDPNPGRLCHLDDIDRIEFAQRMLSQPETPDFTSWSRREVGQWEMLHVLLWEVGAEYTRDRMVNALWADRDLRSELVEVLNLRRDEIERPVLPFAERPALPLRVHGSYTRSEALTALGAFGPARKGRMREGVYHVKAQNLDAFFITLDKSDGSYSASTSYRDRVVARDLVHWETQSNTSDTSATFDRYRSHQENGHEILVFIRGARKDADGNTQPFVFLGAADYVRHSGSKPVAIDWRLRVPMPADVFSASSMIVAQAV